MSISEIDIKDEGLIAAMAALLVIKALKPNHGKFEKLPFMEKQLFQEFHRCLGEFKDTGEIDPLDLKYFQFWVRYFGLTRDEFREIIFTKSLNYERGEMAL